MSGRTFNHEAPELVPRVGQARSLLKDLVELNPRRNVFLDVPYGDLAGDLLQISQMARQYRRSTGTGGYPIVLK